MYRNDTLGRYQLFLNEVIELANNGRLTSLSEIRKKYGVSATLISFMKAKKILSVNGTGSAVKYEAIRKNLFEVAETQMFIAEFNRWKKNGTTPEPTVDVKFPPHRTPKKGSCLADSTTRELINELKRRGYTGTLSIQKEITL